ncbi:MAG TPA: glycosyltransferase [Candidatus Binatia bacterium]|nr:glycosyltransferase [Candidatus Binatia bacterium]
MRPLRILFTNNTLALRAGSELYVRDLALALLARGHRPVAYSPVLGAVAQELRDRTVPVIDDLDALESPPDVIHAHHHLEAMTALLRFPGAPAIYVCHGWLPWEEVPPRFPRIIRYVAPDETCRDRLVCESAIPAERVRLIPNFVDLARFRPRAPLPARPRRALVFSNYVNERHGLPAMRTACERAGLALDVIGAGVGRSCPDPEAVLGDYDVVFAVARSALEALAVGVAVVVAAPHGVAGMVTSENVEALRRINFGRRALREPLSADVLGRELARYDALDAAEVSRWVCANAGLDAAVDAWIALYADVCAEAVSPDPIAEGRAAAAYLRWLAPTVKSAYEARVRADEAAADAARARAESDGLARERATLAHELAAAAGVRDVLRGEHATLASAHEQLRRELHATAAALERRSAEVDRLASELGTVTGSTLFNLRERALRVPVLGALLRLRARLASALPD